MSTKSLPLKRDYFHVNYVPNFLYGKVTTSPFFLLAFSHLYQKKCSAPHPLPEAILMEAMHTRQSLSVIFMGKIMVLKDCFCFGFVFCLFVSFCIFFSQELLEHFKHRFLPNNHFQMGTMNINFGNG